MKNIELLAPVGSMESLYAAVANGADAVYLGGEEFSARKNAVNFSHEELRQAVEYAHLHDVQVHVAVNILLDDEELRQAIDYIKFLYDIDIDAVIVQDIGLAKMIIKGFPDLKVHGSTQMTINNLEGALLLEKLGYKRVVLARETPLEEIRRIKENTSLEIEVFIHGALCVAYSGQCLMSSLIGGRSGNRGSCAQPCRMAYSIVDREGNIVDGWKDKYVLSTKDLNTMEEIEKLMEIGVDSFKIEGRMKRPEYVATIVKQYRDIIDKKTISDSAKKQVKQIFNRGFTKGNTFGDFGNSYISYDRPDNRGIVLGHIVESGYNTIKVSLSEELDIGDGIEFSLKNGGYKGMESNLSGKPGDILEFKKIGNILEGTNVNKTSSKSLLENAKISYLEEENNYPIDFDIKVKLDKKPILILKYKEYSIEVTDDFTAETSKNVALTKEVIEEQIGKLGDTNYYIENIDIELDDSVFLPLSVLNKLRRDAVSKLDNIRSNKNNREKINDYDGLKGELLRIKKRDKQYNRPLNIRVNSKEQFDKLDLEKIDRIYLGFTYGIEEILDKLSDYKNIEVFLWTDKILYEREFIELKNILDKIEDRIDGVSVSNLGSIEFIKSNYDLKIHGDIGLNIFNSYSANVFYELGLDSLALSTELTLQQIKSIDRKIGGDLEIITYGYLPSMIMETCPMALIKNCKDDTRCDNCNYKTGYGLEDRMNMVFRMNRENGITTLYNSVVLMVVDNLNQILSDGDLMIRMDFTIEDKDIYNTQDLYYKHLNGIIDEFEVRNYMEKFKESNDVTNGHYYRGIM